MNWFKGLLAALAQRMGYSVAVMVMAALGGLLPILLGTGFVMAVTGLAGARLHHSLFLLGLLVLPLTLFFVFVSGWKHTPLSHAMCRRINAGFQGMQLRDGLSVTALSNLTQDLELLPVLYTRIVGVLSSLVVLAVTLDAALHHEAWGWYALGGSLTLGLYAMYVSSIAELALFPALRQARHQLRRLEHPVVPLRLGSLDARMGRLLLLTLAGIVMLTMLFGQRPELARNWPMVLALGSGMVLLNALLIQLVLATIHQAHHEVRLALHVLLSEGRADLVTGSTDRDFVEMAQDIYQIAQQILAMQQALQELNRNLEQRIAERVAELKQKQEMLTAILDNVAEGLVVTDREGRLLITNAVFRKVFAYAATEEAHPSLEAVFPNVGFQELLQKALAESDSVHELQMITPDRRVYQVLARALPASTGLGVVLVLHDITRDVELAHMKNNFISSVSHELRTPLTSILGFAKLTRRTFDQVLRPLLPLHEATKRSTERVERNLDILIQESERLTHLINDVLDLAAIDSGKLEWNDTMCEPRLLIEESVREFRPQAEKKGLQMFVELASELPLIKADPMRIRQVLDNLLSNAVKFTKSGWIKVSASALRPGEKVDAWVTPASGGLLLRVQDTGPGVPLESQPYIFERFWQGGDYIHDKPKGTGLGLALSRDIVRHYHGHIGVHSAEAEGGATFYVALPAEDQALSPALPAGNGATPSASAASPTVPAFLIVDDDPAILEWLKQELELRAYRVLTAKNATEAMTLARLHHPDAIVLDLMMPGISGLECLRLLKADAETGVIPVVILSVADEREAALALGASAYLKKPIEVAQLDNTLRQVLTGTRPESPQA